MTELENKLYTYITSNSNFNGDKLDFTKTWEEQSLEDKNNYMTFVDLNEYENVLGFSYARSRALLGSLVKKGLIELMDDEGSEGNKITWIYVNEEKFENAKQTLSGNAAILKQKGETEMKNTEEVTTQTEETKRPRRQRKAQSPVNAALKNLRNAMREVWKVSKNSEDFLTDTLNAATEACKQKAAEITMMQQVEKMSDEQKKVLAKMLGLITE